MKYPLFLLLLCFGMASQAQVYLPSNNLYGQRVQRMRADSAQHVPRKYGLNLNTRDTTPQVFVMDDSLWIYSRGVFYNQSRGATAFDSTNIKFTTYLNNHPYVLLVDTVGGARVRYGTLGAPDTFYVKPGAGGTINLDPTPTAGSSINAPSSGGTYNALQLKNEALNVINLSQHGIAPGSNISALFQSLVNAGYKKFYAPAGTYKVDTTISFVNTDGIEISGDGFNKTIFTSATNKQIFFFSGKTTNLVLNGSFRVETRVNSTTEESTGVIYFYTNGATDTCRNIKLLCSVKSPFAKIDGIHMVSEGTASMIEQVTASPFMDSIGRLAFEMQNHLDRTRIRYRNIHADNGTYTNIGTVTTGVKNSAISFSGPGTSCSANGNYIQDVNEAAGFAYNIGIENAGCLYFTSNNNTFQTINHGFVAIEGSDTGHLTDFWTCNGNKGYLASHTDSNSARGIYVIAAHYSTFTGNNFNSNSYAYQFVDCQNNTIKDNIGKTTYDPVVMRFSGFSSGNSITGNTLNDSSTAYNNANIIFDGANVHDNQANGNKLINYIGGRGIIASINSAYNNDPYYRVDGRVFGSYAGSPEGNVVSEIGGLVTNNTNGDIYKKTTGSGNTGWTLVTSGGSLPSIADTTYPGNISGATATPTTALHYSVYNVLDFGLVNDSVTDNTTAFRALMLKVKDGASIYFPGGGKGYRFTDSIMVNKGVHIYGDGMGSFKLFSVQNPKTSNPTVLYFTDSIRNFLIFDASATNDYPVRMIEKLSIINISSVTPSAGAAIVVRSNGQEHTLRNLLIKGFYVDYNVLAGTYWTMDNCRINGPIKYGIQIDNYLDSDIGDWVVSNTIFTSSEVARTGTAAINWLKGGGGKMIACKFNSATTSNSTTQANNFDYDILATINGPTSDFICTNTSFENFQKSAVKVSATAGFNHFQLSNIQIAPVTFTATALAAIDISGIGYVDINDVVAQNYGTAIAYPVVALTSVNKAKVGKVIYSDYNAPYSLTSCTNCDISDAYLHTSDIIGSAFTNQILVQNGLSNSPTILTVAPSGTNTTSGLWIYKNSNVNTNYSALGFTWDAGAGMWQISSNKAGTGTASGSYVDMTGNSGPTTANMQWLTDGTTKLGATPLSTAGTDSVLVKHLGVIQAQAPTAGGGTTLPAGINTYIQYNNAGAFGADSAFTWSKASTNLNITNSVTTGAAGISVINNSGETGSLFNTGSAYTGNTFIGAHAVGFYSGGAGGIALDAAAGPIRMTTNNSAERFRLNTLGNLSLGGITSPISDWLDMPSGSTNNSMIVGGLFGVQVFSGLTLLNHNLKYNGGYQYLTTAGGENVYMGPGEIGFQIAPSGTAGTAATTNMIMRANDKKIGFGGIINTATSLIEATLLVDSKSVHINPNALAAAASGDSVVAYHAADSTLRAAPVTGTGSVVLAASPALTGSPTAPTQAVNDNTTKIATTTYADRIAAMNTTVVAAAGTTTLSQWKFNWVTVDPGVLVASQTINLPASPNNGDIVLITGGGSIAVGSTVVTTFTVSGNGHTVYGSAAPSPLVGGQSIEYMYDNVGLWKRIQIP